MYKYTYMYLYIQILQHHETERPKWNPPTCKRYKIQKSDTHIHISISASSAASRHRTFEIATHRTSNHMKFQIQILIYIISYLQILQHHHPEHRNPEHTKLHIICIFKWKHIYTCSHIEIIIENTYHMKLCVFGISMFWMMMLLLQNQWI